MKINGRGRALWWTASAVITVLGALYWGLVLAVALAHGDGIVSLLSGALLGMALLGFRHSVRMRRSWLGPRR